MDLQTFWFILIAVLWAGYFLLEGFDFGVGMLLPFLPRDERERRLMFQTIGPVWDGNEVWLVVAGGATFAAFPSWYATMFSGFYQALLLVLVFLIVRVLSFEWRSKAESPRWRAVWLWANTIGSFGASLIWGVGPLGSPLRRPSELRRGLRGDVRRPLQPLHGRRRLGRRAALRVPRRDLPHPAADGRAVRAGRPHRPASRPPCGARRRRLPRLDRRRGDRPQRQGHLPARASGRARGRGARPRGRLHASGTGAAGRSSPPRSEPSSWSRPSSPASTRA